MTIESSSFRDMMKFYSQYPFFTVIDYTANPEILIQDKQPSILIIGYHKNSKKLLYYTGFPDASIASYKLDKSNEGFPFFYLMIRRSKIKKQFDKKEQSDYMIHCDPYKH